MLRKIQPCKDERENTPEKKKEQQKQTFTETRTNLEDSRNSSKAPVARA